MGLSLHSQLIPKALFSSESTGSDNDVWTVSQIGCHLDAKIANLKTNWSKKQKQKPVQLKIPMEQGSQEEKTKTCVAVGVRVTARKQVHLQTK